jgi:hypothetical protein
MDASCHTYTNRNAYQAKIKNDDIHTSVQMRIYVTNKTGSFNYYSAIGLRYRLAQLVVQ